MEISPSTYYEQCIRSLNLEIKAIEKKIIYVSFARLTCAIIAIICIIYLFKNNHNYLWIIILLMICIFLILLRISTFLKDNKQYKKELLKVNEDEMKALSADYSPFDFGKEFINTEHPFSYDLDLFGEASIFQVINRTSTHMGKEMLADAFAKPIIDKPRLQSRQQAVLDLKAKTGWRQSFQATGQLTREKKHDKAIIMQWLQAKSVFSGNKVFGVWLLRVFPAITVLLWVSYVLGFTAAGFAIVCSLAQLIITGSYLKYINTQHSLITSKIPVLKKYFKLIKLIEEERFTSEELNNLQQSAFQNNRKPSASFQKLIKLVDALDSRLNFIMAILLNGLLLWDINCMIRLEKWADRFQHVFPVWVDCIGQFDAVSSLAGFTYNHPQYAMPEIMDTEAFSLAMEDGGHPLIADKEMVTNNIYQKSPLNLFLVTGANMAGKSTFLRTVGLNLVLAMAGTCVCARRFVFTPAALYTSMRTNDSLQKETSFFFAELKKLKYIVDELKTGGTRYILLDEILKGTNSKDQHTGSAELIRHIIRLNGFGIIATHDIALTELAKEFPENIKNIAFEIAMDNGRMVFDYTYKYGVCQNMNASILMKQMGIF